MWKVVNCSHNSHGVLYNHGQELPQLPVWWKPHTWWGFVVLFVKCKFFLWQLGGEGSIGPVMPKGQCLNDTVLKKWWIFLRFYLSDFPTKISIFLHFSNQISSYLKAKHISLHNSTNYCTIQPSINGSIVQRLEILLSYRAERCVTKKWNPNRAERRRRKARRKKCTR